MNRLMVSYAVAQQVQAAHGFMHVPADPKSLDTRQRVT